MGSAGGSRAADDKFDDDVESWLVALVRIDLEDRQLEVGLHLVGDRPHPSDGSARVLLDGGVAKGLEHGTSVEQLITVVATGQAIGGVAAPGVHHAARGNVRDALKVIGAPFSEDILDHATHPEPDHRLHDVQERLD